MGSRCRALVACFAVASTLVAAGPAGAQSPDTLDPSFGAGGIVTTPIAGAGAFDIGMAIARQPDGKLHLVRVVATTDDDSRLHVRSSGGQGSHLLRAMALANALALLPDGEGVHAGETVKVMLLT